MSRFLFAAVLFCLFVFLPLSAQARNNILVVIADDVGVDVVGVYSDDDAYGHPGEGGTPAPTPNIDALAAEGVLFRNAYTNPVCAPTRAQLLTGRHGFRTGIGIPNGANLDLSETTIAELLSPDYETAAVGKWHLGGNNVDHAIDSGFDYFAGGLGGGVGDYYSWTKVTNGVGTAAVSEDDYDTYATTDTADEAIAKIAEFGDDQWFVWVAFNASHSPFHVPPEELTTLSVDQNSPNSDKYRAGLEALDSELGRIIESMDPDVAADTTIIFMGDNGTPRAGVVSPFANTKAKGSMYEGGINVPLIVAGASVPEASQGRESLALVASVDLFATMAEIGEVSADTIDALSILPFVADPDLPTTARRDYIYAEKFSPNGSGPYDSEERAVRGARYKLIWRDGVYEEFYDLDEDPLEDENLLPFDQLSGDEAAAYLELQSKMENVADGVPAPSTTTTTTTPETTTTTVAETTTTSSTTTTTTSTTIADSPCGDVDGNDVRTASDALGILRAALGLDVCPACVCDLDATGVITASDALGLLRYSVGSERGALSCPVCD